MLAWHVELLSHTCALKGLFWLLFPFFLVGLIFLHLAVFKHHCLCYVLYIPTFANQGYRANASAMVKIYCFSRQFSHLTDEKLVF